MEKKKERLSQNKEKIINLKTFKNKTDKPHKVNSSILLNNYNTNINKTESSKDVNSGKSNVIDLFTIKARERSQSSSKSSDITTQDRSFSKNVKLNTSLSNSILRIKTYNN